MARLTGRTRYQRMLSEEPPPTPTPGPVATEERPFVHLYPDAPRYGPYQRRDDPDKGYGMTGSVLPFQPGEKYVAIKDPDWPRGAPPEEQMRREVEDVEITLKEIARWFGLAGPWWPPVAWEGKWE